MTSLHPEEEDRVPQEGTAGGAMLQMAPPATPAVGAERTHVPGPPAEAQVDPEDQLRSGPSLEEGRRHGRNGWAARHYQSVVAVSGEAAQGEGEEECGRERLKRHRVAMAGRVWIPETWGHESLLKDWVDCAANNRELVPSGLLSAREALVEECRGAKPGGGFLIESSCLSA